MMTLAQLLSGECRPATAADRRSDAEIAQQLKVLPAWQRQDNAIVRTYQFANYYETIAFINALVFMIHRQDHHPELRVGYNRCEVRFDTHSAGGISDNDFICAAKADAIFAQSYPA